MTSENLTAADGFELVKATYNGQLADEPRQCDATIDRWTKYGKDRIYFNDLRTGDGYLNLKTGGSGGDKWTKVSAEYKLEDDTLTVKIGNMASYKDFEDLDASYTFEIRVHGEEFEAEEETHECNECEREFDTDTTEAVADGGDDTTGHFTDDEIIETIEQHDDPDHPDATTVAEARTLLADVQTSFEDHWAENLDSLEDGHMTVVYQGSDVIVFADHTGHGWNEELSEAGVSDSISGDVIRSVHHKAARRLCEYSWAASDPFVVSTDNLGFRDGEDYVERSLMWLMEENDLSAGVALDYWMVEWRGLSQSEWARRSGKDQGTVSQNIQKAKESVIR